VLIHWLLAVLEISLSALDDYCLTAAISIKCLKTIISTKSASRLEHGKKNIPREICLVTEFTFKRTAMTTIWVMSARRN
jgi:hypothetical protein